MASAAKDAPAKGGGGLMGLLLPLLVLTVVAAGGGWLIGNQIVTANKAALAPASAKPATTTAPPQEPNTAFKELAPVVTNLAVPNASSWVRLQAAIVFDKADAPQIDLLGAKLGEDILAALRTMTMEQLQGETGLELLREDLNERASIRSDGHIKELIIEMLVIQ